MENTKKELIWFLIPTFIFTYALGAIAYLQEGMENFSLGPISMFVPAIVVILLYLLKFKKPLFKNNDLGLRFKGWKWWLIAPASIFVIVSITYLIPFLLDSNFFTDTKQIYEKSQDSGFGIGHWFGNLIVIFSINTFLAPIFNILMMLGEELSWRGFMTPRLLKIFSPKIAFVAGGTIWALWHGVGIALGLNYPGHPILGNLMMIAMCIPLGIILQYFYFKSKSIFVAAIAHGALNWVTKTYLGFVIVEDNYNTLIQGPTGIIGIVVLSIIAIVLFGKIDWVKDNSLNEFLPDKIGIKRRFNLYTNQNGFRKLSTLKKVHFIPNKLFNFSLKFC